MKRRLPVRSEVPCDALLSPPGIEKRGCQIHPLGEDPSFQTLTPRSLAKSVAELDALRSRVHELELKLSQNEIEALVAAQKSVKKLPPLGLETPLSSVDEAEQQQQPTPSCIVSPANSNSRVIATAPETFTRRSFSLALPAGSPLKFQMNMEKNTTSDQKVVESKSAETLHPPDSSTADNSTPTSPVRSPKRLSVSKSYAALPIEAPSPPREETKITLGHDGGDATVAVSQRQRLYQILKRVSAIVTIKEDELVVLKKLVDAEIGDVIKFLTNLEHEDSPTVITDKLSFLLKNGSPSKHHAIRMELPRQHPVWGIQYPLQKIARNLEHLRNTDTNSSSLSSSPSKKTEVIVLVSSGAYNPIHMLHIRAFYVARQYVESNYKFPVVGAFLSPSHDTYVRAKNRRNPREMITKRHRLGLIEAAIASSSWIEVDKWEITRRRVLDYLSTLTHVREMCDAHFPQFKFHLMYVCGCNTVVKLSHSALRDEGFGCVTVCRPTQTEMVIKHLGKQLAKSTTIVEDTGVLPCDLERATSFRVRKALTNMEKNAATIEMMVGKPVYHYFLKHNVGAKIAGKDEWSDEDKQWRDVDLSYVEYVES